MELAPLFYLRPKLKKPPFEDSDFGCPSHHCPLGTLALTAATCCPQPLHVVLPQVLHLTGEHIVFNPLLLLCYFVEVIEVLHRALLDDLNLGNNAPGNRITNGEHAP